MEVAKSGEITGAIVENTSTNTGTGTGTNTGTNAGTDTGTTGALTNGLVVVGLTPSSACTEHRPRPLSHRLTLSC